MTLAEATGTIGVFVILLAYVLLLLKFFDSNSILYLGMNFIGASIACVASILIHYWPFVILEACWAVVSLIGIVKALNSG